MAEVDVIEDQDNWGLVLMLSGLDFGIWVGALTGLWVGLLALTLGLVVSSACVVICSVLRGREIIVLRSFGTYY